MNDSTSRDDKPESKEVTWERWQKKRTFVRALEGTYGELKDELFNQPRTHHTRSPVRTS